MPKKIWILLLLPLLVTAGGVERISMLFDSLKAGPTIQSDSLLIEKAKKGEQVAIGKMLPNVSAFGTYDLYNTEMGMVPIAPNELLDMVKDPSVAQPFSDKILRVGVTGSMPIFMRSIYSMVAKAKKMSESAEAKKKIDILKNEAMLVGLNANLKFIDEMIGALNSKDSSLQKTKELITIMVNSNRAPQAALLKISVGLNTLNNSKGSLKIKRNEVISKIETLTGVRLDNPIDMELVGNYQCGEIKALDPIKKKVEADISARKAESGKLWPMLILKGGYNHSMATAYNNDKSVNEDFANVGLVLKLPLFTFDTYKKFGISRVDVAISKNKLESVSQELTAQAHQFEMNLSVVNKQITKFKNSISNKKQLLNIAKTAFTSGRMSIEDYLKYEDDYVLEKAKLYKAKADKWQTVMKLAVIYGNNIEEMVK